MIDISNYETLENYLLQRGVINKEDGYSIKYLNGGVSCTVSFVYAGEKPLIIKQGLSQLKVKETWLCDPNRMNIEQESNRIYHKLVPDCAPEVYFYDGENYIYGRQAVPESCRMWKADLLDGLLDYKAAAKCIRALVTVHNHCARDGKVAKDFENKNIFYDLRVSPYIEFILKKHLQLEAFARPIIRSLMDSKITLVHGDFSPKNIMIDGREVSILDYEVAHYGHPSFDLAFFSNHFILKSVKNKQWAESYLNMLEYMLGIYFGEMNYMDADELDASFTKLLSLLMIARVDGKSPAEYITEESDKQLIRDCAFSMIDKGTLHYRDAAAVVLESIRNRRREEKQHA